MPGNEVGDRVHNFFGHENLSQAQYNSQTVDGNWPELDNNLWASSQRTAGAPFASNLKNFNVQQSDSEQGHPTSPHLRHGLTLPQSNLSRDSGRNQLQNQQTAVNGYMQGHQVFQRQSEANILGLDTESDWHSIPRGMSVLESQGNGLELFRKNLTRNEAAAELPVNFDFFGAHQQISSRHPGMLQSISRQPSGINDMQLLQQQVMVTRMQELQRQQQFHQLETRQQNSRQTVGNHSVSLVNSTPINGGLRQPEVVANASNVNWLQRGACPVTPGSSNSLLLSHEQRQALRLMGLAPNQGDQSFYGIPISSSTGTLNLHSQAQVDKPSMSQISLPHQFSHVQGDKPALPNISANRNSFPAHQYAAFSDQTNSKDGNSVSRENIEGNNVLGSTVQAINGGLNMGGSQQGNSEQRNVPMQNFHGRQRQDLGTSETSLDKMAMQVPPPSQNVAALDPTEEKILFGSDENLWGAFGRNTGALNMLDGTDSLNGFPSLQSGSWSALMQSAVAETSTSDMGAQEEWSSLSVRNTECLPGNEQPSTMDSSKQQTVWAENNLQSTSNLNSRSVHWPDDVNRTSVSVNYGVPGFNQLGIDTSHDQSDRLQTDSSLSFHPHLLEKDKQKPLAELSHIHGNATNSSGLDINSNLQVCNEESGINGIAALPSSGTTWVNQQLPNSLNVDVWRDADSSGSYSGNEGRGKYQHHMEKNPSVLESSMNDRAEGVTHDIINSKRNKSAEGLGFDPAHHRAGNVEDVFLNDNNLRSPKPSNLANQRPPLSHKLQYHPMGDLATDVEPSHGNKHVINSQQIPLHSYRELKGQNQSYGQSKFHHTEMDKGDSKTLVDNTSNEKLPDHIQKMLAAFHRGEYPLAKTASPRVTDGSVVHPQQNQSALSQGFGLQLAPPTQWLPRVPSQGTVLSTSHVASETGVKGRTWLGTAQTLPSQESSHGELRSNSSGSSGHIIEKPSPHRTLGDIPQAFTSGIPFSRILSQNHNMANIGGNVANTHEMENKTDKSAEALGSNSSPHHRNGGERENVRYDGSDLQSPKFSNQVNQRPPISGKLPYQPVGDWGVNAEPSYGSKHAINSQPIHQQPFGGQEGQDQRYHGQSKLGHTVGYPAMKGDAPAFQGDSKSLVGSNASNNLHTEHNKKPLASFDRRVGGYGPNKTALPWVVESESSDGSVVHPQQNQSSSQGFGLQLAPPNQWLSVVSSHGPSETVHVASHVASETGDKGTLLASTQTFPSQGSPHVEHRSNISGTLQQIFDKPSDIPQASMSGFPFSRIHTQNPNVVNHGRHVASFPRVNATYIDKTASMNQIDEYCEKPQTSQSDMASVQEMSHVSGRDQFHSGDSGILTLTSEAGPASQPCVTSGELQHSAPSNFLHNVWASVSSKQPAKIPSRSQPVNDCEMTAGSQKPGDKDSEKGDNDLSDVNLCSVYSNSSRGKERLHTESCGQQMLRETADVTKETARASQGKESVPKYSPDESHSNPAANSGGIEAFGRSLRPNNFLQQCFSSLHQVQSTKTTEFDPGNRDVKRLKASDYAVEKQEVATSCGQQLSHGYNAVVKDVSDKHSSASPSNPHMLNLLSKSVNELDSNTSSPEALGYGQKNAHISDSDKAISARSGHSLVSPQTAPSWFEQYGALKNSKISLNDIQNMKSPKIMDQPSVIQNQSENLKVCSSAEQVNGISDAIQLGDTRQSPMPASVSIEHVPSRLLPPPVEPDLIIMRPKKRKCAISGLIPWHKELEQGSERLRNISAAELDWAKAANRLIEKIEEDAEIVVDLPLTLKSKRRLVLTSQLMQQLLNPPPATVLSADVKLHHESVVYSVARLALGDACSSVSWSGSDALMPPGDTNIMSVKLKSSQKIDRHILKVVEHLVGRAKKLENDLRRLDNRATIVDLRVERDDIERNSVINRFVKFHRRDHIHGAETSLSSDAAAPRKIGLHRYVIALPTPKNFPDMVQCFSL